MSDFKQSITELLKKKRPNLSDNSLRSYTSTLANLPKKCGLDDSIKSLHNTEHILKELKDIEPNKRRSIMAALFVITECPEIKKTMDSDMTITNKNYRLQKKSETEKENWVNWNTDVLGKYNEMKQTANALFKLKTINPDQLYELSKFVLLSLYVLMPPRRIVDYSLLKFGKAKNADKDFNYVNKDSIVFNQYKTKKAYGQQTFSLPLELQMILKKWKTYCSSDFVITNRSGDNDGFSSNGITKMLNNIFEPKEVSCNLLRHSYITEFLKTDRTLAECDDLAAHMAHSVGQQTLYKKIG